MAKRKVKVKKFGKILLLMVMVISAGVIYLFANNFSFFSDNISVDKKSVKKVEKKVAKDYSAKMLMVGDALIHSAVYEDARQVDGTYDFTPMLSAIKPISSQYDLAYYNQETILGGASLGYSNYPRFNSPQEVGDAFVDAGFNMVSLATNHTMDKGEQGVLNSVAYWKSKTNVVASGQWSSEEERTNSISTIHEINGIKYAYISYTIWTNGLNTPVGKEYLNNLYSEEKAKTDIESVRDKVDFVIVAMHWGTEYSFNVDNKQEEIANYLSNLGVDLIIGAHPHVIQTAEYINNNKTFVIYSLGNFISDQNDRDNFTGLAFEVTLDKHVDVDDTITNTVIEPKAELIYTTTTKIRGVNHNFKVVPYPNLTDNELANHNVYYEKYKSIVNERYPNLVWGLSGEVNNGNN